jgi:hypothetical protein
MSLFENQIKTLITTLENIPNPKSFNMTNWHSYKPHIKCGFAACICGHQALAPSSEFFNYQERPRPKDSIVDSAVRIAELLDISCFDLTGDGDLATSIYGGNDEDRRCAARGSRVFSLLELDHPFLHSLEPPIKEALSYMRLVLTKLGGFDD